jgi:hypothetical protein
VGGGHVGARQADDSHGPFRNGRLGDLGLRLRLPLRLAVRRIRPRFGAGAGTAAKAGFVAWLLAGLLSSVGMANMGIVPTGLLVTSGIWTLVESVIVTIVGAWLYKEA